MRGTMKQTAVEWLADNIMPMIPFHTLEYRNNFIKFIKQAKEMEKEQIIESYCVGCADITKDNNIFPIETSEQYYKETFKSE